MIASLGIQCTLLLRICPSIILIASVVQWSRNCLTSYSIFYINRCHSLGADTQDIFPDKRSFKKQGKFWLKGQYIAFFKISYLWKTIRLKQSTIQRQNAVCLQFFLLLNKLTGLIDHGLAQNHNSVIWDYLV